MKIIDFIKKLFKKGPPKPPEPIGIQAAISIATKAIDQTMGYREYELRETEIVKIYFDPIHDRYVVYLMTRRISISDGVRRHFEIWITADGRLDRISIRAYGQIPTEWR